LHSAAAPPIRLLSYLSLTWFASASHTVWQCVLEDVNIIRS
jgi:hypothetical protein